MHEKLRNELFTHEYQLELITVQIDLVLKQPDFPAHLQSAIAHTHEWLENFTTDSPATLLVGGKSMRLTETLLAAVYRRSTPQVKALIENRLPINDLDNRQLKNGSMPDAIRASLDTRASLFCVDDRSIEFTKGKQYKRVFTSAGFRYFHFGVFAAPKNHDCIFVGSCESPVFQFLNALSKLVSEYERLRIGDTVTGYASGSYVTLDDLFEQKPDHARLLQTAPAYLNVLNGILQ